MLWQALALPTRTFRTQTGEEAEAWWADEADRSV